MEPLSGGDPNQPPNRSNQPNQFMRSDPRGGPSPRPAGIFITRTTMVRAAIGVVVAGALVGLGFFLRGSNTGAGAAPPQSSPAALAAPKSPSPAPPTSATVTTAPASAGPTTASTSSDPDPCVVGTWRGVLQVIPVVVGEPATFSGTGPQQLILGGDRTGSVSYGSGVTFSATIRGLAWTEVVTGGGTGNYDTSGGQLLWSNVHGSGTQTLYVDGIKNVSGPLTAATSVRYLCSGNVLKLYSLTGSGSTELTRTG